MIEKGGVIIADVRTIPEYDAGHISGLLSVPLQSLETAAPAVLKNKNDVILVYCRTGIRSARASKKLADAGYKNIYDIQGGITQWPYEITKAGEK